MDETLERLPIDKAIKLKLRYTGKPHTSWDVQEIYTRSKCLISYMYMYHQKPRVIYWLLP